jgi:L-serine/L-threonine ammonia-lyase
MSFNKAGNRAFSATGEEGRRLGLYVDSPLIPSKPMSDLIGCPVYLKLDVLQPSGSFKDRGMANLCVSLKNRGIVKLISSSGGNAGLSAATVGRALGMEVDVIVPETTKPLVLTKLETLGARVTVHGENWNAADSLARSMVQADVKAAYVSPFDDPLLWSGHSSIMDELAADPTFALTPPSCVVASVGGGGLLCGVLEGCERLAQQGNLAWGRTRVLAMETEGCASFAGAWDTESGCIRDRHFKLPGITSIATSLGATSVTPAALDLAESHIKRGGSFLAGTCTDAEAVDACLRFAKDHRMLVEPACGAALAVVYSERLRGPLLFHNKDRAASSGVFADLANGVVIEVCGGNAVTLELLATWKRELGLK